MSWVPLHVHSQYSILDATASISQLVAKASRDQLSAIALTDHGNLYGAVEWYKSCKKADIQPIIGCELYLAPESRTLKSPVAGKAASTHITLLAKNQQGYVNLCRLSSKGFIEGYYYTPRIDKELLKAHSEGIICLSGCLNGVIPQALLKGNEEKALEEIRWFRELFKDDFYLELMRHQSNEADLEADGFFRETWLLQKYQEAIGSQQKVNAFLIATGAELGIPCVATNDTHFIERSDWKKHEILINVQSGEPVEIPEYDFSGSSTRRVPNPKRQTYASHECYFKSPEQMQALFSDHPEAISNTLDIAKKCNVNFDFKTKHYPVYWPEELDRAATSEETRRQASEDLLWKLCREGMPRRYTPERLQAIKEQFPDQEPLDIIENRLKVEMEIIVPKGMTDYLLIVWDFIHWAKSQGIPVGPGRGSGAGSIVLYLIGITDIEPIRFHLYFERFINPERISYPDIDVDICMDQREKVIQYTLGKYGHENVAQIITFGAMKAKSSLKDVGRVLSIPLAQVNALAKLVPEELDITLEKTLERDPDFARAHQTDRDAKRLIDFALELEGTLRSTGIHAAGLIVAAEPLTNYIPICVAKDAEMPVTQFSMKPVEEVGMLKIDFLGLKTLTSIQMTVEAVKRRHGITIDWVNLPLDDPTTFELLNQGKTSTVFQLESGGVQDLARQLHLDNFEEIIAVGALYRPGPIDMIPSFIARKHGQEPIEYDHPWLKEILSETYGIMVYQEQVMQIAQKLANYSLGEGDILRRAMGKKEREQMAQQREKFRLGALENAIDEETSMRIFDKMEKFAAYGFNKSHATAYGYLSYVTAYFKANYPAEWYAALMSCDRDDLSKVAKIMREARSHGIAILPPDVNESDIVFAATSNGIRFALSAIRGVGSGVVEVIVAERDRNGPFKSLYDFTCRVDGKKVGKKIIENIVEGGGFDFTGWSRDQLVASIDEMFDAAARKRDDVKLGANDLFARVGIDLNAKRFEEPPAIPHPRNHLQLLAKEKEMLGLFLTGHPMEDCKQTIEQLACQPIGRALADSEAIVVRAAFIVETVATRYSNNTRRKFAILTVSDGTENLELPIWSDLYEESLELLVENRLLYGVIAIEREEGQMRLYCSHLGDLTQLDLEAQNRLDQAFDAAKKRASKRGNSSGSSRRKGGAMTDTKPAQKLLITLDADALQMSHLLVLKAILNETAGDSPTTLRFEAEGKALGEVRLNTGVNYSDGLVRQLSGIHGCIRAEKA
ncbi:MAG: DNA polymerase III subunit alpha [Chlamydiia bacterium]|nr:DNA polymerase III subunit alpha [Chlamydiia bacterium]